MLLIADQYKGQYKTIMYLPGGAKTIVTLADERVIYFNNIKTVEYQLEVLRKLQQSYKNWNKIKMIDVGSLENPIITLTN